MDAVDVGVGAMDGMTNDERQTVMTFWAAESAPLYSGDDLTKLDSFGLSLLTNTEVIAVDQAARPARPVSTSTSQQVWAAHNPDGSVTVALFNLGSSTATVTAKWSDLGLSGSAAVRDLWSHTALGSFTGSFSASQHWNVDAEGTVTAVASGLCLDVTGTANSPVKVATCTAAPSQHWRRV